MAGDWKVGDRVCFAGDQFGLNAFPGSIIEVREDVVVKWDGPARPLTRFVKSTTLLEECPSIDEWADDFIVG